jgi:ribonuclease D
VAHNAVFEYRWVKEYFGVDPGRIEDTMIMSRVLYAGAEDSDRLRHGLADVAKRELDIDLDKDEQESDWARPKLTDEQIEYAEKNAAILPKLYGVLRAKLEEHGLWEVYELERRVSYAVDQMERDGFAVHEDRMQEFIDETTEQAERLKEELAEAWGIKPGSSKQLIERFNLLDRAVWPETKGGQPSTNQDAMKLLYDEMPEMEKFGAGSPPSPAPASLAPWSHTSAAWGFIISNGQTP